MKQVKVRKNLEGMRFSRLLVLKRATDKVNSTGKKAVMYLCRCDCGTEKEMRAYKLVEGTTASCGCLRDDRLREANSTHGCSPREPEARALYQVWKSMNSRCLNKKDTSFKDYGARGITVCDEWTDTPNKFVEWAKKNNWERGLQIDRKDNDDGYYPENCHFVTPLHNMNNQQLLRSSNKSGFRGVSWRKTQNKWHAYINYNWKRVNVGYFDTKEEAAKKRDEYAIENGLDVPLNFEIDLN